MTEIQIETWPIDRLKPYDKNPREITTSAVDKVCASIAEFGWQQPIVVDVNGVIIAGHTRLLAAKKLGLATVPVHVASNLNAAQVKAFRIADNRTSSEAKTIAELLAVELGSLRDDYGFDLQLTALDPEELRALLADDSMPLPDESAADSEEREPTRKVIFTASQFEVVNQAIMRIRDSEQDSSIGDARAIELAIADWLLSPPHAFIGDITVN